MKKIIIITFTLVMFVLVIMGCVNTQIPQSHETKKSFDNEEFISKTLDDFFQTAKLHVEGQVMEQYIESEYHTTKEEGTYEKGVLLLSKIHRSEDDYYEVPYNERITKVKINGKRDLALQIINDSLPFHFSLYFIPNSNVDNYSYDDINEYYGRITFEKKETNREIIYGKKAYIYTLRFFSLKASKAEGKIESGTIMYKEILSFENIDSDIERIYNAGSEGFADIANEINNNLNDDYLTYTNVVRSMFEFKAVLTKY